MTQASLSPELHRALGADPAGSDSPRHAATSVAAFWMVALTSTALVAASVLLLGLLTRNVITDASLGGFVSGIAIVIAVLGVGGVSYALVTAHRAGYLDLEPSPPSWSLVVPPGMHVVPAIPADLGRRRRLRLEAERAARSRQARAIATAAATTAAMTAVTAPPRQWSQPMAPPPTLPRQPQTRPVRTPPGQAVRPVAAHPAPAPAGPPGPAGPVVMPSAAVRSGPPASASPRAQAPALPSITMPRQVVRQPRPAAWPAGVPVVRLAPPPMRPRTQVAMFQVNAADVRAASRVRPR